MSQLLVPTIAAYVHASNARDPDALVACFTPQAVVTDEGHTHRGGEEFREWAARTQAAFSFTLEVANVGAQGSETIATCQVSGDFPGSPIELNYAFTLAGEKIARLEIVP